MRPFLRNGFALPASYFFVFPQPFDDDELSPTIRTTRRRKRGRVLCTKAGKAKPNAMKRLSWRARSRNNRPRTRQSNSR